MEYCEGGDLFERIKQQGPYHEHDAAIVCMRLASVLDCLHRSGMVQRDLKPENILLSSEACDTDVFLADFGSAAKYHHGSCYYPPLLSSLSAAC